MTITYDPHRPEYADEADVRGELTRVFDVCQACRRCVSLCAVFPTLFDMIDRKRDHDAGLMTPAEQDMVVDECIQCSLCVLDCPYAPGLHEWNVDVPRLMLRAVAMQHTHRHRTVRERITTALLCRTDLVGRLATSVSPLVNRLVAARPRSLTRRMLAALTGLTAVRALPPFARERFSTWFDRRPTVTLMQRQGKVTVFPTCLVEYHDTNIGTDLVKVFERNGIECRSTVAGCCGAPWLHAGDVERFTRVARRNVEILAAEVRAGTEIVVPQPGCGRILRRDYVDYVGGDDADLVAAHTSDAAEYLMRVHHGDTTVLDTDFAGATPSPVTYHAACHLRAQDIGLPGRDLLMLTGARVAVVQQCAGIDGVWGLRGDDRRSVPIAERLGDRMAASGDDVVAGDCHLANTAIVDRTGRVVRHPLQIVARAYGIAEER